MATSHNADHRKTAAPERFQFRIRDLLLVMLLAAIALAAAVQQSVSLGAIFLVAGIASLAYWQQWSVASAVSVMLILGTLLVLFYPVFGHPRTPSRRSMCSNNLKQVVIALHNYHDIYGSFPPAYIADQNGRPMHSWRVLILPFMEQENLYKLYRFDEPWDGPNNRKLADRLVRVFSCADKNWKYSLETSYVAVIGPHTAWPGEKALTFADLQDGPANVLLVVEVHHSGIHWMEPRDLHVSQMAQAINAPHGQGISSHHPHGANAGFADGHIQYLDDSLPADVLRSWINIDDGTLPEPP